MKKFDYKSEYKKFYRGDKAEITFIDNGKTFTKEVLITHIDDKKISFEDSKTIYECTPSEIKDITKLELPILQWSLDILGLLSLLLLVFSPNFCKAYLLPVSLCSIFEHSLVPSLICFVLFIGISMRGLILHPKQYPVLWTCIIIVGFFSLQYNISSGWNGILWAVIVTCFFPSIFSFFFWDRSAIKTKKDNHCTPKYDAYFYITLSSIAYGLLFYFWGIRGREFSFVFPLLAFPVYILCLLVWAYRGWGWKAVAFVPIIILLLISTIIIYWANHILGIIIFLLLLSATFFNRYLKSKKEK